MLRAFRVDAARGMHDLVRTHGDVVQFNFFGRLNTLVAHPDQVREVLITHARAFRKGRVYDGYRPLIGDGLLTSDGSDWETARRIANPSFRHDRLLAFYGVVMANAEAAVRLWAGQSGPSGVRVPVLDAMNGLTFDIIQQALFSASLAGDERARLFDALARANREGTARIRSPLKLPFAWPTPANRRYRVAVAELDAIVDALVARREGEANPPDDYLSTLLDARDRGEVSPRMVRDQALTFLFAGHETTSNALCWALKLLADHPVWADRVAEEAAAIAGGGVPGAGALEGMEVTRAAFEEAMRLYPPIYAMQRSPLADIEIGGWPVPAGSGVTVSPFVTHRHPDFWPDAERFDPERFIGRAARERDRCAYIPFGAGPRTCIAANFAMAEGIIVLAALCRHFRFEAVPGAPAQPTSLISLSPGEGFALRFTPR